jgi:WD40 repeat protein
MPPASGPVKIFVSYGHEDEEMRDRLEKHLAPHRRKGLISIWSDRRLEGGAKWEPELRKQLEEAGVVVLLLSPDFFASDYCMVEMEAALDRYRAGTAKVIPVILKHCEWEQTELAELQVLPQDALPISAWPDPDAAYVDVVRGIRRVIDGTPSPAAERQLKILPPEPEPDSPGGRSQKSRKRGQGGGFFRQWWAAGGRELIVLLFISVVLTSLVGYAVWGRRFQNQPETPELTPPAGAVLRLELGMHSAPIRQVAVDKAERYLVTASDDGTARIWDLESGELLKVLRPPREGSIRAVAISPDGSKIAVGAFAAISGASHAIDLFERATGRLLPSIGGLAHPVKALAFGPDGTRLAAAFEGGGLGVFDSYSGTTLFSGLAAGDCQAVDYAADFRLALACSDGLRVYPPDPRLPATASTGIRIGARPKDFVFSPDGKKLAVSYVDGLSIEIYSAEDLELLYARRLDKQVLLPPVAIAWTPEGRILAAGRPKDIGRSPVFLLEGERPGQAQKILPGPADTVLDLRSLPSGRLVYGAADPAWAVVSDELRKKPEKTSAQAMFAALREGGLQLSRDGNVIRFSFDPILGDRIFDLRRRSFGLTAKTPPLAAARTEADGLILENWDGGGPRLDGRQLDLPAGEISRSLAIAQDGASFLLGSESLLQLYRRNGQMVWRIQLPAVAWAVNLSGDGRLALAALGDGTLRFFDAETGKELLAFFPHHDGRQWVMWTPSGYYDASRGQDLFGFDDASPGGEALIGWQVYRGPDQPADFYPAADFSKHFHRPAVIDKILETRDEAEAVRLAG